MITADSNSSAGMASARRRALSYSVWASMMPPLIVMASTRNTASSILRVQAKGLRHAVERPLVLFAQGLRRGAKFGGQVGPDTPHRSLLGDVAFLRRQEFMRRLQQLAV